MSNDVMWDKLCDVICCPYQVQQLLSSSKKRGSVAFKEEADSVDRKVHILCISLSMFVAYSN